MDTTNNRRGVTEIPDGPVRRHMLNVVPARIWRHGLLIIDLDSLAFAAYDDAGVLKIVLTHSPLPINVPCDQSIAKSLIDAFELYRAN